MAENVNIKNIELTPEVKDLLKKNFFFVNKAKFPSFFAASVLMAYFFMGLAIFVVIYFRDVIWTYVFAALLVTVAFFYTFRWFRPYFAQKQKYSMRPSHNNIENWFVEDLRDVIKPSAIEMLSLNPATITPDNFIIIPHPVFWRVQDVPEEHITFADTGEYKIYSTHNIQVIALSEKYISFYKCTFDWLNNKIVNPYTLEFFFDDISSIRVENKKLDFTRIDAEPEEPKEDVKENEQNNNEKPEDEEDITVGIAKTVIVRNKSGESMNIIVNLPLLESSPRLGLKTEKVMQTLRIMLRHRRYGEEFEVIRPSEENKINQNPQKNDNS